MTFCRDVLIALLLNQRWKQAIQRVSSSCEYKLPAPIVHRFERAQTYVSSHLACTTGVFPLEGLGGQQIPSRYHIPSQLRLEATETQNPYMH